MSASSHARRALAWWMATMVAACSSTQPTVARNEVADILEGRSGLREVIPAKQDAHSRAQVRERVEALLAESLTQERALQIAVLNNRGLRATFENLGVAQADLVAAGLLENPVIAGDLVNSTTGNGLGGGLSLSQSLLSAFLIPAKRRIAKAQLRAAVLTVADATLGLVRDVRVAHANVAAAMALRDLHHTLVQTAEVGDALAARQHEAGNLSDLDRELFAADLDAARLELSERELQVVVAREDLNRLLGLWGAQIDWELGPTPEAEAQENLDLSALEQLAVKQRLDVSAARVEVEALQYAVKLRRRAVAPAIDVGFEARNEVGNDAGHEWVLGPSLSLEIPIFDPGHADFARLRSHLRRAQHQLEHAAIVARSEIRLQREALVSAGRRLEYLRKTVLPRRETVGAHALERYNAMLIGVYELLEIRAAQARAEEAYVEAVRDYWSARADLERASGGRLPRRPPFSG